MGVRTFNLNNDADTTGVIIYQGINAPDSTANTAEALSDVPAPEIEAESDGESETENIEAEK